MNFSWATLAVTSKEDKKFFWTGVHLLKIQPSVLHNLFPARACLLIQPDITCNIPALFCKSLNQSLPSLHSVILHREKELPTFPCWTLQDFCRHSPQIYSSVSRLSCCYLSQLLSHYWHTEGTLCITICNTTEGHWTIWVWYQAQGVIVIADYPPDLKPWIIVLRIYWSSQILLTASLSRLHFSAYKEKAGAHDVQWKSSCIKFTTLMQRTSHINREDNQLGQA